MHTECVRDCPENAECLIKGCTITPQPGYWHSTSFSTQIKKCIFEKACNQLNRTEILSNNAYAKVLSGNVTQYYSYDDPDYNQCSKGYTGRLCGRCEESYSKAGDQCEKCLSKLATAFFILLQYMLTIGIIVYFIISVVNLLKRLEFNRTYNKQPKLEKIKLENIEENQESFYPKGKK